MTLDIEKLKALALAATPGKWEWDGRCEDEDGYAHIPECSYLVGLICLAGSYEGYQDDCDYIAAACPATVLELIAEVERLRAAIAGAEKDAELADVLNTTLWLYRRLPHAYGNPPFVDKAILAMAERLGLDDVPAAIKERAAIEAHTTARKDPQ